MTKRKILPQTRLRAEELDKCVNCGLCQAVCPTYLVKGDEGLTARGKIALLKDLLNDTLKPSASIADLFDDCLTCYACQTVCPPGVRTQRLWTAARQDLTGISRTSRLKHFVLNWTIAKPKLFDFEIRLAGILVGFKVDNHQQAEIGRRKPAIFRGAPYLRKLKEEYHPQGDEVGTVGLLLGCSSNLTTPWIADAVIKLLTTAGWRVVVPRDQVCCGAPAINNGAWDIAKRLARVNLKVFTNLGVDRITSADGTCAGAFKHDYRELFRDEPEMLPDVERLSHATTDLSVIIAEALEMGRIQFSEQSSIIALHDSCHVTHLSMGNRWRDVLSRIDGLELKKLPESEHCCGFGGSYTFSHPETSFKIAAQKVERALGTGVSEMLVGSPGCLMRLQSVVNERHSGKLRIRHVVEFLQDRLKPT